MGLKNAERDWYLVFFEAEHHEAKHELVDGGGDGGEADEQKDERAYDVPGVELPEKSV